MKIALIAMSGIRAHNPELTEMGMTLPGFVERGQAIASLPSLSLLTLAALTPERHQVSYHEIHDIADVHELPDAEVVAIATFTAQVRDAYQLSDRYRKEGVTTVMGGLHVTSCPDEALGHADIIVIGEGEVVWCRLLDDVESGQAERVYDARSCEWDLAEAPIPRFDLLDAEDYNRITVQTNRGCPWRCEFCASSILLTPRYKIKPVSRVIEEIRAVKDSWPRPFIEFDAVELFVTETKPFDVQITVQTPFPGTPLYDRLRTEGRLLEEGAWEKCTLFDVNYLPLGMTPERLERGLIELGQRLYSEEATRSRRRGFIRQWREGRRAGRSTQIEEPAG